MKRNLYLFLLLSICAAIGVRAQNLSEHYPEYRIQRSDVLDVKYRYTPEYDETIRIRPDGQASMRLAGDVQLRAAARLEFA